MTTAPSPGLLRALLLLLPLAIGPACAAPDDSDDEGRGEVSAGDPDDKSDAAGGRRIVFHYAEVAAGGTRAGGETRVDSIDEEFLEVTGPLVVLAPASTDDLRVELATAAGGSAGARQRFLLFERPAGEPRWNQVTATSIEGARRSLFTWAYLDPGTGTLGVRIEDERFMSTDRYPWRDTSAAREYGLFVVPRPADAAAGTEHAWLLDVACGFEAGC